MNAIINHQTKMLIKEVEQSKILERDEELRKKILAVLENYKQEYKVILEQNLPHHLRNQNI